VKSCFASSFMLSKTFSLPPPLQTLRERGKFSSWDSLRRRTEGKNEKKKKQGNPPYTSRSKKISWHGYTRKSGVTHKGAAGCKESWTYTAHDDADFRIPQGREGKTHQVRWLKKAGSNSRGAIHWGGGGKKGGLFTEAGLETKDLTSHTQKDELFGMGPQPGKSSGKQEASIEKQWRSGLGREKNFVSGQQTTSQEKPSVGSKGLGKFRLGLPQPRQIWGRTLGEKKESLIDTPGRDWVGRYDNDQKKPSRVPVSQILRHSRVIKKQRKKNAEKIPSDRKCSECAEKKRELATWAATSRGQRVPLHILAEKMLESHQKRSGGDNTGCLKRVSQMATGTRKGKSPGDGHMYGE